MGITSGGGLGMPPAVHADDYPYQSQPFVMDGAITHVDADRDRVTFAGDDGKTYTLDTSDSQITLSDGNRAGMTADLAPGMRVHVGGRLLSVGIAEAQQMRVLDDSPPRARPTQPTDPPNGPGSDAELPPITLRGTVDSIDTKQGAFVVRVKSKAGEHTRTILLADNTDLSGMALADPNQFPVKPGDRVTVAGSLEPDKTVLAGVVSLNRDVSLPPAPRRAPVLLGRVSSTSNRLTSRDIKIRLDGTDREVKIKVPRGIPIRRDGQTISVHDLHGDDPVRVTGAYDGTDFRASRIDVLDAPDALTAPGRRGL